MKTIHPNTILGLGFAALATVILAVSCGKQGEAPDEAAGASATATATKADYQTLVGRWSRTDSNYTLEVRRVSAEGRVEAAYFNPRPINVARAEVSRDGDKLKLVVELRDAGYPGCLYKLSFDPAQGRLVGTYFQAAMNEIFEVAFARAKE